MGLFNKLKNALFEEEEIELPIAEAQEKTPVVEVKEEKIEKIEKAPKEEKNVFLEDENERELFKSENTFKFPEFDEEEFKTSYKPPVEKEEPEETPKERIDYVKPITFEYDKKTKQSRKENIKKEVVVEQEQPKKTFRPSPVISPVYGVLDKNYKKEDIMPVKEEKPKKKFDVDAIRKKAFGTLEDDIERTFEGPKDEFYNKNSKNVNDLLNDSADDTIDIKYDKKSEEVTNETPISRSETRSGRRSNIIDEEEVQPNYNNVEQELDNTSDNLQVLDEVPSKSEEQSFEEDTLENDLFDLIDSMYDSREDEEE